MAEVVVSGLRFPESPRWHGGRLWISDFFDHRVLAVYGDGSVHERCRVPGQPSGLGWRPDGTLLVVSMLDRTLLAQDAGGEMRVLAELGAMVAGALNDMVVDPCGRAWIGGFGATRSTGPTVPTSLLTVGPDDRVAVAAVDLVTPNGMALTPDGRLLVAETFAGRISSFGIGPGGVLSDRRIWAVTDHIGAPGNRVHPDGLALDAEGCLWVGDARGSAVLRLAPGGEVIEQIAAPGRTVYAPALGGPDGRTLFLCAAAPWGAADHRRERTGVVLRSRVPVRAVAIGRAAPGSAGSDRGVDGPEVGLGPFTSHGPGRHPVHDVADRELPVEIHHHE